MLSFASPVFSDMFSIPPPSSKNVDLDDEIQTVLLSENSDALDLCLRHVYPLQTPDSAPLRDASILAEFAHKYQVDALEKSVRHYLADNIKHDPVGVYAIAVTYGYKGVGKSAVESCLNLPFSRVQSPYARYATTENFAELLRYHVSCGEASSAVATDRTWFSSLSQITFVSIGNRAGCQTCTAQDFMDLNANAHGKRYAPQCLWSYLHRSALILARHPTSEAVAADDFVLKAYNCAQCPPDNRRQMLELSRAFRKEITKAIERVPLPEAVATRGNPGGTLLSLPSGL